MTEINLKKCCRICLRTKRHNKMKLLSSLWNNSISFVEMLNNITPMKQECDTDKSILKLCATCELDLITTYNFNTVCQKTEKILKDFFDLNKQQPVENLQDTNTRVIENYQQNVKDESDTIKQEYINDIDYTDIVDNDNTCWQDDFSSDKETEAVCNETTKSETTLVQAFSKESTANDKNETNEIDNPIKQKSKRQIKSKFFKNVSKCTKSTDDKETEKKPTMDNDSDDQEETFEFPKEKRKYVRRKPLKEKSDKPKPKALGKYCRRCNLEFEARKNYLQHYREVHMDLMPCTLCGKMFYKHNLEKHLISHSDEKNHVCSLCGSRFSYEYNLKAHMRIHSGERRYKCDFCDETFIHWNTKKSHMYVKHTREKKYECYICHRLFGQNSTMKVHVQYHTGDLPCPCPFCEKRFPSPNKLRRHIMTHRNIPAEEKEKYLQK